MRQFVGEIDLTTKKIRYLIPNKDFTVLLIRQDLVDLLSRNARSGRDLIQGQSAILPLISLDSFLCQRR